ncbi:dephospho-CoA kinase [Brevibacterium aurantiacum]|uniref:Dephospho-CoA kinase n=1 Tax=Brevibacterium aurantiacum TaxID=273384 RepID=A0A2H1HI70_BREAU|nr:dephospho-CoA kinase [Brevibacterium aurantiacum]GEB21335.1 dephospho-CoA kinase [Brevibacterium aurantiacum]SMX62619.1 dephospho-CoA kinase [Brevibacterium aurantiacum]
MLKIGLTGGIGAGKSTVSEILADHGAAIIDADKIAREVVAPGEPLLAQLAQRFGEDVIADDGGLDRAQLAAAAFGDEESTAALNALMHPAIRDRTIAHFAEHADAEVVVHDVPLLVENGMTPSYHLNLLVDVPAELRLQRLMSARGMDRADAQSRIARQATDEQRYAVCDVIIDNAGEVSDTRDTVARLVEDRILPFAANLAKRKLAQRGPAELVEPVGHDWSLQAQRIIAKLHHGLGDHFRIDHIGSTAVPDLAAKDIIDLQLLVSDLGVARDLSDRLAELGFPGQDAVDNLGEGQQEAKRFHANTDPGQAVNLHVRTTDSVGAAFARKFVELLSSDESERRRYEQLKRALAHEHADHGDSHGYAEAKEPYFLAMRRQLVPASFD